MCIFSQKDKKQEGFYLNAIVLISYQCHYCLSYYIMLVFCVQTLSAFLNELLAFLEDVFGSVSTAKVKFP